MDVEEEDRQRAEGLVALGMELVIAEPSHVLEEPTAIEDPAIESTVVEVQTTKLIVDVKVLSDEF